MPYFLPRGGALIKHSKSLHSQVSVVALLVKVGGASGVRGQSTGVRYGADE